MALHELLGRRYDISIIIDPIPGETTYIDAGGLRFGVEFRELNAAVLDAKFGHDPEQSAIVEVGRQFDEVGVAVHVMDAATHTEYIRLDAFLDIPHYHYIVPGSHHTIVYWDEIGQGLMIDKLPEFLSVRLRDMLAVVMPADQVDAYRWDEIEATLPTVYAEVDEKRQRLSVAS